MCHFVNELLAAAAAAACLSVLCVVKASFHLLVSCTSVLYSLLLFFK